MVGGCAESMSRGRNSTRALDRGEREGSVKETPDEFAK
jgi:hypothetical protein